MGLPQREQLQSPTGQPSSAPRLSPGPSLQTAALMQLLFTSGSRITCKFMWEQRDFTSTWAGLQLLSQCWCWLILQVTSPCFTCFAHKSMQPPPRGFPARKPAAAQSCLSTSYPSPDSADTAQLVALQIHPSSSIALKNRNCTLHKRPSSQKGN